MKTYHDGYCGYGRIVRSIADFRKRNVDVLDLASGVAAEDTPREIVAEVVGHIQTHGTRLTAPRGDIGFLTECARIVSADIGRDVQPDFNLTATHGCRQGLMLALAAIVNVGDEIILEDPCFISFEPIVRLLGAVPVRVPLRAKYGFKWTRTCLDRSVSNRTVAIVICSPHNPTGVVHSIKDLERIAEVAIRNNIKIISDEIYNEVLYNDSVHTSIASLKGMFECTIVLRGFSKRYCMAGWRIGYAFGPKFLIDKMVSIQTSTSTSPPTLSQIAATYALRGIAESRLASVADRWHVRSRMVADGLSEIEGVRVFPPAAGYFLWVNVKSTGLSGYEFAIQLLKNHKVAVVSGDSFGTHGANFIRINCIRPSEQVEPAIGKIRRFVESRAGC